VPHLVGGDCIQRSAQAEVRNMIVDADCRVALEPEGAEAHQPSRNGETGTPTPLPRLRHPKEPRCFRFGFSGFGPGRCDHLEPLVMSSVSEMPTAQSMHGVAGCCRSPSNPSPTSPSGGSSLPFVWRKVLGRNRPSNPADRTVSFIGFGTHWHWHYLTPTACTAWH
jgi:hypothetical protein